MVATDAAGVEQTQIGLLPVDWAVRAVKEFATPVRGASPRPAGDPKYFNGSYIPWLTVSALTNLPETVLEVSETETCLTEDGSSHSRTLKPGTVIIANSGATLGVAKILTMKCCANDGVAALLNLSAEAHALYVVYYFNSKIKYLREVVARGNGQPNLNTTLIGEFRVPLPPAQEQEKIAAALHDVDSYIHSIQELIDKKRAIKQGAMQELLSGKRRLPGFNNSESHIQDQYGSYPTSWQVQNLIDVVDPSRQIRYGIVQPGSYDPQGRYMIRGQDYSLAKGWADPNDVFRVSDDIEERYKNARVRSGDLIITIVGYCGHVEMVPDWLDGANLTQTTARLAIHPSRANALFCKHIIRSPYVQNQVTAFLKGNAQPGLNCSDVERFRLPLPPPQEQAAIAAILTDMDQDSDAIQQRLHKARQIKQGMMQQLLTGRVRLV
jgi:type I restriction enzyme S subunit